MTLLTALAAAAALARAALPGAPAAPTGDVHITGDSVTYDVATGRVLLEGNAVVRRGAVVLRARSISWDPVTEEARASGGVLLTDPTRIVSADAVRAVLGREMEAEGVLAFVKDRPVDLSGLRTVDEARRSGRNRLTFSGDHLSGSADGPLRLSRARLTLCDCAAGRPPSWEVTAREADIVPGKRAILHWSVLRIAPPLVHRTVPVFAAPWLYLPLGERQSGLLLPVIGSTFASGFGIAQPLYLTLGRSADATLTPEYAFGRKRSDVEKGEASVRGPGARLELRWIPAESAEGRAELGWLHDLDAEPGGESGDRWALTAMHGQRLGARTALAGALRLAGDPVWIRDTTSDQIVRTLPYRRSDLLLSHRRGTVVGEAFASYDQPLRPYGTGAPAQGAIPVGTFPIGPYGLLGSDVGVASRWGSAAAALVPIPAGPLRLSARAGAARFGPATGGLDVVGRSAASRADARVEIEAPMLLGGALTVAPYVRGAALGYAFDEASDPSASAWGVTGAAVGTEVSRNFGRLRHAIAPRLEWRAGTRVEGDVLQFAAYDALDRSTAGRLPATPGAFHQLRASVETRLEAHGADVVRAELGQDVDLRGGRLAETFAALAAAAGPVRGDARASFFTQGRGIPAPAAPVASWLDRFSELRASLSVEDRRGDLVRAGFFTVAPGGSSRLVVGMEPLFDVRPADLAGAAGASAGFSAVLGDARVAYDARFPGRTAVRICPGEADRQVGAFHVQQHSGRLIWESSCRCFRITLLAGLNECGEHSYHASIDLAGLAGSLGR